MEVKDKQQADRLERAYFNFFLMGEITLAWNEQLQQVVYSEYGYLHKATAIVGDVQTHTN